jgi:hypothetical protein
MNHAITVGDIIWLSIYSVSALVFAAAAWFAFLVYVGVWLNWWRLLDLNRRLLSGFGPAIFVLVALGLGAWWAVT